MSKKKNTLLRNTSILMAATIISRVIGLLYRSPLGETIGNEGTGADNEVWSFGEKNYEILTKFIGVREKMRDYTRSLMAEAHEKGTPVMRTMFYEFPEDAACWDISDAYMFGSDILVAPIVRAKATSRTVYLPAGASWTLANTGDVYEGGKAYEIEAPIETLPIFLRDGKQGYLVGEI